MLLMVVLLPGGAGLGGGCLGTGAYACTLVGVSFRVSDGADGIETGAGEADWLGTEPPYVHFPPGPGTNPLWPA